MIELGSKLVVRFMLAVPVRVSSKITISPCPKVEGFPDETQFKVEVSQFPLTFPLQVSVLVLMLVMTKSTDEAATLFEI